MGDVTTRKFVGDASLNNDFCNISNGANFQLPLDTQKQKGIQLPPPPLGAVPFGPPLEAPPPNSALAVEFELCAVLN